MVILAQHRWIKTERLLLRPLAIEDLEDYHVYTSDDALLQYDYPAHQTLEESLQAMVLYNMVSPLGRYGIVLPSENRLIGNISFKLSDDHSRAEIGYAIHRKYHNQGYATECCKALIDLARQIPSLKTVTAVTDYRNIASQKVLEKCGFVNIRVDDKATSLRVEQTSNYYYEFVL